MSEFKITEFKMADYKNSVSLPDTGPLPVIQVKKFVVQNSSANPSPAKQPQNDAQKKAQTPSVPSLTTTKK